ncbi:P-loop containing nucleoside triphosphate hydrolase protein [Morchella snyderi]|nr:P-loop containing nucleoside triphosphate hydrolase protein [Morchella snyderi]
MDPSHTEQRKSSVDPNAQRHLYGIKVIPIYRKNAKIFPSWSERNSVRVCALFDPLTLEIHILFYDDHTIITDLGSKDEHPPEKVLISSSFFILVYNEARRYITLQRQKDVEGKMLGSYKRQCPSGQESLAAKVASDFYDALIDLKDRSGDSYPSLEFYFKDEKDKTGFFNHWSVSFGRESKEYPSEALLHQNISFPLENPDTIKRNDWATPTSIKSPKYFQLVSESLAYERSRLIDQLTSLFEKKVLEDLECHLHGDGSAKNPFIWEIFIPYSKIGGCKIPEYKMHWQARVIYSGDSTHGSVEVDVQDHSIRMLREPLLPLGARKDYYMSLISGSKVEEFLECTEEKKYWCLKLLCPAYLSKLEPPKKAKVVLIPETSQLDQTILSALEYSEGYSPSFDPSEFMAIHQIFLGHRLGRLLPVTVYQRLILNTTPSCNDLLPEQADIYRHVIKHDFTLVDGAPGTGKSTTATKIISDFIQQGKKVLVMATSETVMDFSAATVLDALPREDSWSSSNIVRLYSHPETWSQEPPTWTRIDVLDRIGIGIHPLPAKNSLKKRDRITAANAIFMTTETALNCYKGCGISRQVFDLIIIEDANTIDEGLALKLTRLPFSNSVRWLVMGCSKGIGPTYLIEDFRQIEICNSWFRRLLGHPEFRLNPLRLTRQMRCSEDLYRPLNNVYFGGTITTALNLPFLRLADQPELCMGFFNTANICWPKFNLPGYDQELIELEKYNREKNLVFYVLSNIRQFSPNASLILLTYCRNQAVLMEAELVHRRKFERPLRAHIEVATVEDFASKEADYTIIHLPLWKNSYEEYADHGKFVIAMTRARNGVFVVGHQQEMEKLEKIRGTWDRNPWNDWLKWVEDSDCGAFINNLTDFKLRLQQRPVTLVGRAE